jgi:hypothetical protein
MTNSQSLSEWIAQLTLGERVKVLNLVSFSLTIHAREFQLPSDASEDPLSIIKKLLGLNELHHKLSSQIGHYCDGEEAKVYPVEVFSKILFEVAAQYGVTSFLNAAITYARSRSSAST